jgi:hypothetical protein
MGPAAAMMVVGVGLQAYSAYRAGKAQAAQAKENARRARMLASDALQRGEQKAGMVEIATTMRTGAQEVAYGHAGVDTTSGSAARTIATTAMVGALDATIVRNNAFREAWGYELQARGLESAAREAEVAARWSMFGALFGGAGQVAGMQTPASAGSQGAT